MSRTIHFVYSVPRSSNIVRRGIGKIINKLHFIPIYRNANDFFIPWRKPIRAPHSISYHMLQTLKKYGKVKYYSLYEHGSIPIKDEDILLGIPSWNIKESPPTTIDEESIFVQTVRKNPNHKNIYFMMPYSNDSVFLQWANNFVKEYGKNLILIGGKIWEEKWNESHWKNYPVKKRIHVEMAVNPADYPHVKKSFNPKGKRGYLYIGHTSWYKNTKQLEEIAEKMSGYKFGHIGFGNIKGWDKIAEFADMNEEFMTTVAKDYDCFVNVSCDAQATTILEQMCFGMCIACTPESGYDYPSITKLSMTETDLNVTQLKSIQEQDEIVLLENVKINREIVIKNNTWKNFCNEILKFINIKNSI